ncbi:MAG TPA: hydrogenase expression protein HupH [Firmicutes bacterium]|nr:hydrogenase expression protein HupH [Bacillota bacterium]
MRIRIIRPVSSAAPNSAIEEQFRPYASPGTEVLAEKIRNGPSSVESRYDVAMAATGVVECALVAQSEGFDACIVNCFADPGLGAAREVVRIPVVGAGESAMLLAASLGATIGIITVASALRAVLLENARAIGLADKITSISAVDIPVRELGDRGRLLTQLKDQALTAVKKHGAHVLVLGCTGMTGTAASLHEAILEATGLDVPVVDPVGAAMALAEGLARMRIAHSALSYCRPPHKMAT